MKTKNDRRRTAISFGVSPVEKRLIIKAARAKNFDEVGAYIRETLMARVKTDIESLAEFQISSKDMQVLLNALDKPVQNKPGLQKLLRRKSVLDRTRRVK